MAHIREQVEIEAPPDKVWRAVHEDLRHIPRWSLNVARVELLNGRRPGPGSRVLYEVKIPGRTVPLEFEQDTWDPPRKCAGHFTGGPVKGTWAYTYSVRGNKTRLLFTADYELGGLLRWVAPLFHREYAAGVAANLESLRGYLEASAGAGSRSPRD